MQNGEMIPIFLSVFFYSDHQILLVPNVNGKSADLLSRPNVNAQIHKIREKSSQTLPAHRNHASQGTVWPSQGHSRQESQVLAPSNNYRPVFFLLRGSHRWETAVLIRKWAVQLKERTWKEQGPDMRETQLYAMSYRLNITSYLLWKCMQVRP